MKKHMTLPKLLLTAATLFGTALAANAADTIKLGLIAPLTGGGAPWGVAAKIAAEIISSEVAKEGGIDVAGKKYQFEVITYDDQYKASEAVAAYNRLVNQDEARFLMTVVSAPTLAIKQNAEDDEVLVITGASAPAAIDDKTKHMIRYNSVPKDFLPAYLKWMAQNLPEKKIITMNPNDETGWAHSGVTGKLFAENGLTVVSQELYERSTQDFAPLITKVLPMGAEVIDLGSSSPAAAALIIRTARELGYKGRFLQTVGSAWKQVLEAVGPEGSEGLVNVLSADTSSPGFQALAKQYRDRIGQDPNEFIAIYYDSIKMLLAAIQKAGTVEDVDAVVAVYPQVLPMKSVQGTDISWGGHMQVRTTQFISIMKNGKPAIVDTIQ